MRAMGRFGGMGVFNFSVLALSDDGLIRPYDWYRCKKISWRDLAPNPRMVEWMPARYGCSMTFSRIDFLCNLRSIVFF